MTRPPIAPSDTVAINAVLVASRQAVDAICDRWSLALVLALFQGETRFGGLLARTGMANRLLTARLRALETGGVLARTPYGAHPARHDYHLTEMGWGLFDVILQMARWEQHWAAAGNAMAEGMTHTACGAPLRPQLRCAACDRLAGARDIELRISPAQLRQMPDKQTARRRSTLSGEVLDGPPQQLGPSLDIFGDKWGIEILLCAFFRIRRFGDFRLCTGIAANILSDRLARLTAAEVLTGEREGQPGYWLTEKGIDLYGVIVAIQDWADAWLPDRYRSPVRLIHRDCGQVFKVSTTCAACAQVVGAAEVRWSGDQSCR
jgi:DNA-binding HxlR family transcriptional regulator